MIMIHNEHPLGVVVASGTWQANTVPINGLIEQVLVKPTTQTTEYDFSLTNDQNQVVYRRTDVVGTLNEETNLPIRGVFTMKILNSTRDEDFDVLLSVREI